METVFVGKNLIFLPVTDSTNSYAIELLKNVNPPDGTVVRAAYQLKGKGQRGSTWMAGPASNLTVSVILKTAFLNNTKQFFLYVISALAVYDTTAHLLGDSQFDIKIKWPNDILVQQLKISGILIENRFSGEQLQASVIGIGLNLNQCDFGELRATSVKLLKGKEVNLDSALEVLCSRLEKYFLLLRSGQEKLLTQLYTSRLFGLNEVLDFSVGDKTKSMRVLGIGKTGLLQLKDQEEKIIEADLKDVKWLF